MADKQEKTLEQVLRETPWSAILVPLAIGVLAFLLVVATVVIED
jgi:hypothetical protein